MKIFTLHTGIWDDHHLTAVFSTQEKAEAYVKIFNVTDSPQIKEIELDPHDSILTSNKKPYLASCKKKDRIKLKKKDIYDFFKENNVSFSEGTMYYYFFADNDDQAFEIAGKMRDKVREKDWNKQTNLGKQIL